MTCRTPGQIAKQIVEHLEGLRGLRLLGWPDTVKLLDWMAKTTRTKGEGETKAEEDLRGPNGTRRTLEESPRAAAQGTRAVGTGHSQVHRAERHPARPHHKVPRDAWPRTGTA